MLFLCEVIYCVIYEIDLKNLFIIINVKIIEKIFIIIFSKNEKEYFRIIEKIVYVLFIENEIEMFLL